MDLMRKCEEFELNLHPSAFEICPNSSERQFRMFEEFNIAVPKHHQFRFW